MEFEVNLTKTESYAGVTVIEADTLEQAQRIVNDKIYCDDLEVDWEFDDETIQVDSLEVSSDN